METRRVRETGEASNGVVWIAQSVTGVLLLGLLGLHMIAHHFVVEGGLRDYADVMRYVGQPVIFALEIIFLFVVTFHALLGVRSIIFDLGLKPHQERLVTRVLLVVGIVTVGWGLFLAVTLFNRA